MRYLSLSGALGGGVLPDNKHTQAVLARSGNVLAHVENDWPVVSLAQSAA